LQYLVVKGPFVLEIQEHHVIGKFELHLIVSYVLLLRVGNKPVYGVAIWIVDGIRRVLELIGASKYGCQRILWHNLWEEPVCYLVQQQSTSLITSEVH
jgi:hypothetical protein